MKEIADILNAYQNAQKNNLKTALATVVKVEGSSYRRPGARMLITEDGILTGAISGGCLEGDALKKALSAIHQQQNKLITYDTTDEDDAKFGVQLGCNGIVHILFEPIQANHEVNPIQLLNAVHKQRENTVLVTLYALTGTTQIGTVMVHRKGNTLSRIPSSLETEIFDEVETALADKKSQFTQHLYQNQTIEAFIEFRKPPIALIIAGAGNDAQPLAQMAYLLGWHVTIVDGRPSHVTPLRFPHANRLLTAKPPSVLPQLKIDAQTAFVLMTHNYNYDSELLSLLLETNAPYIGSLGPKKKLIRMLTEQHAHSEINEKRIHGPVGFDIGAETAEEIAISIVAEIKTVLSHSSGRPLKDKKQAIHALESTNE